MNTKFEIPKDNIDKTFGFSNALSQLLSFVQKETEFNPEKRFIDSVKILDMISGAAAEIKIELQNESEKLNQLNKAL